MHPNAPLRWLSVAVLAAVWLAAGWQMAVGMLAVVPGTLLLTMGFSGDRGERIWLVSTLVVWMVVGLWTWQGALTECPSDGPNHCTVR